MAKETKVAEIEDARANEKARLNPDKLSESEINRLKTPVGSVKVEGEKPVDPEMAKQLAESEDKLRKAEEKLSAVGKTTAGQRKLMDYEVHNSWEGVNYKKPYWRIKGRFRNDAGDLIRLNGKVQVPVGRPGTVPAIIVFKNGVGVTNNHAAARKMFKTMVTPSISSFNPAGKKKSRGITVLSE